MAELESTKEMQRALDESVTDAHSGVRARYQHLHIDTTRGGEEADTLMETTYADIDHYSITPRTFESRTYNDFAGIYGLIYRDEFAFDSNRVTRFGINSTSPNLRDILVQDSMKFYNLDGPESTVKSKGYRPEEARQIQLSDVEKELLGRAIEHLLSSKETKTVVIDILARQNGGEKNGNVKIKNGEIETHSVVLYKNPAQDLTEGAAVTQEKIIFVIDPSNFLFSSHLSNYQSGVPEVVLKTFHKSIQIYKPLTETGPNFNQYRDCIDCAVKIALGLNTSEIYYDFTDQKAITDCPAIKHISNQVNIDEYILFRELPTRGKQTSDNKLVDMFFQTQNVVANNLHTLDSIGESTTSVNIRSHCAEIIGSTPEPLPVIKELMLQNDDCITNIVKYIESILAEHKQLIGELISFES